MAVAIVTTACTNVPGRASPSTSSPAGTSTATTAPAPPVAAALLHPLTPADDPALRSLLGRACRGAVIHTCYAPGQIQVAYDLTPLYGAGITGRGVTIGIVDSFGSPTIRRDLASFDRIFHLPAPPRFRIIQVAGKVPPFSTRGKDRLGWALETTLDVEWAHALAPGASITLAETPVDETEGTAGLPQMVASELYMIRRHLADVISQSFAATEQTFSSPAALRGLRGAVLAAKADGVTVLAASGDNGPTAPELDIRTLYPSPVTEWPATDPLVTAVGGLSLHLDASGRRTAPDAAWNDSSTAGPEASGGGLSSVFGRPAFQDSVKAVVGARRGIPDVSMLAATSTPAAVVAGFSGIAGAGVTGASGTSLATPMFAAVVALADQLAGHHLGWIDPTLYRLAAAHAPGIVDVSHGDTRLPVPGAPGGFLPGYRAGPGYDLATGLGTVDAAALVPELAGRPLP